MSVLFLLLAITTLLDPPPLNINTASEEQLLSLTGIGPARAAAIVQYRDSVSPFLNPEELLFVPGMGPSTLEAILPYIVAGQISVPEGGPSNFPLSPPADTLLTVVFLDVGNGDAIVLSTAGETWLMDAGPPGEGNLRAPVVQRLMECGFDSLAVMAFTHPHADHIGGCRDAMEVFRIGKLIDPGIDHASPVYEELLEYALGSDCDYEVPSTGTSWELSPGVTVEVVWLERGAGSPNEASAVYSVTCGSFSLLLTGDIENETLMGMTPTQQPVTVVKVPHHGSGSSLFPPWFRRVIPRVAVFTCGRNNPFGHPHPDVVSAWENTGAEILRTDLNGNIFLYTDGESMTFTLTR